jgi:Family of unknown function (DUF6680)
MNQTDIGILTIIAIFSGPILAVIVTRFIDHRRLKQTRRLEVFRTLMRTRRMRLNPDHVGALNLVEIEFYSEKAVIDSWKAYWNHLHPVLPPNQTEVQQMQLIRDRDALLTKLLHAMAKSLRIDIEQLDILEGGYAPQGWLDDEMTEKQLRALTLDILSGRRGIPVMPFNPPLQNNPYPPAPEIPPES